jgi:dihydropyrimidinase
MTPSDDTTADTALDTVITGGRVVDAGTVTETDIGIRDGTVVELGAIEPARAGEVIDASGSYVLPGVVDEHVHPDFLDDFTRTSECAALGGVTTMLCFAFAEKGESLLERSQAMLAVAEDATYADFSIHAGLLDAEHQLGEIPAVWDLGIHSFKLFTAYPDRGRLTGPYWVARVMQRVGALGGLVLVHCEDGPLISVLEEDARSGALRKADPLATWLATRPPETEAAAVGQVLAAGRLADCSVLVVHITSAEALHVVAEARAAGQPVIGETCPHYLALTEQAVYDRGGLAKVGPPLRPQRHLDALWQGISDGTVLTIGSDHAPNKDVTAESMDIFDADFGMPGIQTMLPVVWNQAVETRGLGPEAVVQLLCERPARAFGLWPRKGSLQVGADADLVIWDPSVRQVPADATTHSRAAYTLYAGRDLPGPPNLVLLRGRPVVRDGALLEHAPAGRFVAQGEIDAMLPATL